LLVQALCLGCGFLCDAPALFLIVFGFPLRHSSVPVSLAEHLRIISLRRFALDAR